MKLFHRCLYRVIPCEFIQKGRSPFLKRIIFCTLISTNFHITKKLKKNSNPLGSPSTAVFIMRKNAFSDEMEVCDIFYISITIEAIGPRAKFGS
jgi:hypothetical protein